jgi:hypothetical protein
MLKFALPVFALAGMVLSAGFALADQKTAGSRGAQYFYEQTAQLRMGTILLRVIPHVGGKTMKQNIQWDVVTFGRNEAGNRVPVAKVSGATPKLFLPAGWYIVFARMSDKVIKHPVEVTANRTFKYTLVKN